jgi:hypothetical protein
VLKSGVAAGFPEVAASGAVFVGFGVGVMVTLLPLVKLEKSLAPVDPLPS